MTETRLTTLLQSINQILDDYKRGITPTQQAGLNQRLEGVLKTAPPRLYSDLKDPSARKLVANIWHRCFAKYQGVTGKKQADIASSTRNIFITYKFFLDCLVKGDKNLLFKCLDNLHISATPLIIEGMDSMGILVDLISSRYTSANITIFQYIENKLHRAIDRIYSDEHSSIGQISRPKQYISFGEKLIEQLLTNGVAHQFSAQYFIDIKIVSSYSPTTISNSSSTTASYTPMLSSIVTRERADSSDSSAPHQEIISAAQLTATRKRKREPETPLIVSEVPTFYTNTTPRLLSQERLHSITFSNPYGLMFDDPFDDGITIGEDQEFTSDFSRPTSPLPAMTDEIMNDLIDAIGLEEDVPISKRLRQI